MKIIINGKIVTKEELDKWKKKRCTKAFKLLNSKVDMNDDVDTMAKKLTDIKMGYTYEKLLAVLKNKLAFSEKLMKVATSMSFGKRKFSITEIEVKGISAKEMISEIDKLMLVQSRENDRVNLSAHPEHYALRPLGGNTQEVIETTGNSPLPVQFFIDYGDETGLQTPRDYSYEYQSAGIAKLKDGTLIGGVKHQFKETEGGFKARLVVEFPAICPTVMIKEHQMHLACEFSYWFNWIINQKSKKIN